MSLLPYHYPKATLGQGFLLMGGDCAEAFDEFNVDHVRDTFRVILQVCTKPRFSRFSVWFAVYLSAV